MDSGYVRLRDGRVRAPLSVDGCEHGGHRYYAVRLADPQGVKRLGRLSPFYFPGIRAGQVYVVRSDKVKLYGGSVIRTGKAGRPKRQWGGKRPGAGRKPNGERVENPQKRAHYAVAVAVRTGRLPRPDSLLCRGCGHLGADRRHEYHHHLGYVDHELDVVAVCTQCHFHPPADVAVPPNQTVSKIVGADVEASQRPYLVRPHSLLHGTTKGGR